MTTTACAEPGCTGSILDGYCDVCGSPAPKGTPVEVSSSAPSMATMPAGVAQSPSTVSRASNRLASTALGSARAGTAGSSVTRRVGTSSTRRVSASWRRASTKPSAMLPTRTTASVGMVDAAEKLAPSAAATATR